MRWRARYRATDGRELGRTVGTKTEAERWLRANETAKDTGAWIDPKQGKRLFGDWVEDYETTITGLRPSSLARDRRRAGHGAEGSSGVDQSDAGRG